MIKKSIASILVLLIIINSIGCYSKAYLPKKELDKLSEGDNIIVTTKDRKAYDIRVVRIIGQIFMELNTDRVDLRLLLNLKKYQQLRQRNLMQEKRLFLELYV